MDWLQALILGIVQGLAEYLPISSSGHLEIFREILGINLPKDDILTFDIIVHAATVCSTIVVLRPLFAKLCRSFFAFKPGYDFNYVCKILLSCIPIGFVGVFCKDIVKQAFGDGLLVVGICLCVTALLLTFAHFSDRLLYHDRLRSPDAGRNISWLDAFIIGMAQAVAVLPGLSRSGTTIATGIILGDKRAEVANFSFLMVIIPILGEALLDVKDLITEPQAPETSVGALSLVLGFAASFLVGCAACKWMINLVKRGKLVWFALYCVVMGVICILW